MKTAVIPQVSVASELREQLEAVLARDETIGDFVEGAVRRAVEQRRVEMDFHARGEAAWQHYKQTGVAVPGDQVIQTLQARLDAKRKQLAGE